MSSPNVCPCCGQSVAQRALGTTGKRICSLCNRKIGRHGKWGFGPDGRPRHKDCSMPDGKPREETMSLELK